MASTILYVLIAILILVIVFLVAIIRSVAFENTVIGTPSIPREKAVLTAFASAKIQGTVDEVFDYVIRFQHFGEETSFSEYKWQNVDGDGIPLPESPGTFKLELDPLGPRRISVKLNVLDRKKKIVSEVTTKYPPWLLASERVQEILPVPGNPSMCEYRAYMTGEGLAAYYLLLTAREELVEAQRRCAENLRDHFLRGGKRPQQTRTCIFRTLRKGFRRMQKALIRDLPGQDFVRKIEYFSNVMVTVCVGEINSIYQIIRLLQLEFSGSRVQWLLQGGSGAKNQNSQAAIKVGSSLGFSGCAYQKPWLVRARILHLKEKWSHQRSLAARTKVM